MGLQHLTLCVACFNNEPPCVVLIINPLCVVCFSITLVLCCVCVGEARIRVQISAVHSKEEVVRCAEAFIQIAKEKKVIP